MTPSPPYKIKKIDFNGSGFTAQIILDPRHYVFEGHFPENPIVPGVWLIHAIKDIVSELSNAKLKLIEANNIKFLNVIDPNITSEVGCIGTLSTTDSGEYKLIAEISDGKITFVRFRGSFKAE